jgi:tRNA uridine 5-carboxymethylaminomethyl modification enzyme
LLRQPEQSLAGLESDAGLGLEIAAEDARVDAASVETAVKYEGYLLRQQQAVARARRAQDRQIPNGFPFDRVPGLSRELVQRFGEIRPSTLGHASRIPGATPAAIAVVDAYLTRFGRQAETRPQ